MDKVVDFHFLESQRAVGQKRRIKFILERTQKGLIHFSMLYGTQGLRQTKSKDYRAG